MIDQEILREVGGRMFVLVETTRGWGNRYRDLAVDVFEVVDGQRRHLNEGVDPAEEHCLTDEVLLALAEPRRQDLMALMRAFNIVANGDYQYDDDYQLLYSTAPVGRYAAVSGDESYHWINTVDTVEKALESLAGTVEEQIGNTYSAFPVELRDLETGELIPFRIRVTAERVS